MTMLRRIQRLEATIKPGTPSLEELQQAHERQTHRIIKKLLPEMGGEYTAEDEAQEIKDASIFDRWEGVNGKGHLIEARGNDKLERLLGPERLDALAKEFGEAYLDGLAREMGVRVIP